MRFGYRCILTIAKGVFHLLYRYKVYRTELPYVGGAILAANHTSFLDPPLVAVSWPEEVHFLASDYLFKVPIFGKFIHWLNARPVHRGASDLGTLKQVHQVLANGGKVVIFPEGKRSPDGQIAHLKTGVAMLALKSGAAIIPAYISGTYEAWNKGRKFPRFHGHTAIIFGAPILMKEYALLEKKEAHQLITHRLAEEIASLKQRYEEMRPR